jgi:hypothetical protein
MCKIEIILGGRGGKLDSATVNLDEADEGFDIKVSEVAQEVIRGWDLRIGDTIRIIEVK